ncbi:uncharacterized protein V6R79_010686 [Siganus canaliculatus]
MLGFIHVAVVVLSLLSVGQTAPVTSCETLIQPLKINGREQLEGNWLHVAESTNSHQLELFTKKFQDSYWIKFTAANESDAVISTSSVKGFGVCISSMVTMILENNSLHPRNATWNNFDQAGVSPGVVVSMKLLETSCSDCLLIHTKLQIMLAKTFSHLLLLGKTRNVSTDHLKDFEKQAECLNLRQPYSLKPEEEPCPEPPAQDTEDLDLPRVFVDGQMTDVQNFPEKIFDYVGGRENITKLVAEVLNQD